MKLINYTPSRLYSVEHDHYIEPSGQFAKVTGPSIVAEIPICSGEDYEQLRIPIWGMQSPDRQVYLCGAGTKKTEGFPPPVKGTLLIVSQQVRLTLPGRRDLISPSGYVRNDRGEIMGFQHFEGNSSPAWAC